MAEEMAREGLKEEEQKEETSSSMWKFAQTLVDIRKELSEAQKNADNSAIEEYIQELNKGLSESIGREELESLFGSKKAGEW
jgi:flagellar hook-basal body complex protein FliE